MDSDPKYIEAKRHVAAAKGFYVHLLVYLFVMSGLIGINVVTKTDWWVQWPLLGWGIGILGHALGVFAPISFFGRAWEERRIKDRIAKM